MHALLRVVVALFPKGNLTGAANLDLHLVVASLPRLGEACDLHSHFNLPPESIAASP